LTTHYMDEAETLCDRVAIMDHGKILQVGAPANLVRGLHRAVHVSLAHGALDKGTAAGLPGADSVHDDGVSLVITSTEPAALLTALVERGSLADLQVRGATLEDVFLELTGREYRA
ncbi:MAG: ABC transporter ATP-binding protein, partial [Mycobacteriales bacterium]